jgi:hypothetical protein
MKMHIFMLILLVLEFRNYRNTQSRILCMVSGMLCDDSYLHENKRAIMSLYYYGNSFGFLHPLNGLGNCYPTRKMGFMHKKI